MRAKMRDKGGVKMDKKEEGIVAMFEGALYDIDGLLSLKDLSEVKICFNNYTYYCQLYDTEVIICKIHPCCDAPEEIKIINIGSLIEE